MKLGVTMSPTAYSIRPDDLAVACEERGFESLWFPEHSHIPTSRRSPVPTGGELPKEYAHTHDLFIALTLAAAATKTIKLGSGICLAVQRDPIMLAKEVARLSKIAASSSPTRATVTTIAMAMPAAISTYSIAVAPDESAASFLIFSGTSTKRHNIAPSCHAHHKIYV